MLSELSWFLYPQHKKGWHLEKTVHIERHLTFDLTSQIAADRTVWGWDTLLTTLPRKYYYYEILSTTSCKIRLTFHWPLSECNKKCSYSKFLFVRITKSVGNLFLKTHVHDLVAYIGSINNRKMTFLVAHRPTCNFQVLQLSRR